MRDSVIKTEQEATLEFDLKTGIKDIYHFLLYYSYTSLSGIVGLVISLASGAWLVTHLMDLTGNQRLFFCLIFLLYTVVNPLLLWFKAKNQADMNPFFSRPAHYALGDAGICIRSGTWENRLAWKDVVKVRESGHRMFVYMSRMNALIWLEDGIGDADAVRALVRKHVDNRRVRFKR